MLETPITRSTILRGALTAAAAAVTARPATAQAPALVRVTNVAIDAGAEVYYAKELGLFAKAGLDVEISPSSNGGAAASAVAGNAVDIGYADTVTIATAVAKSVPFVIIAPAAMHLTAAPTTLLLVAPNAPIRTAADLNGKIVAGSGLGTISGYSPRAWIDQNGGDSTSVKFVEMAFPAMAAALEAGRIDAAAIAEPFLSAARKSTRSIGSPYDAVGKEFLVSCYFTTSGWAKEHADVLARFTAAIRDAATWANENHAKSATILVQYTKIDPALTAAMTRVHYGDRLTTAYLQPVVNVAAKYGKFPPYNAQELIYAAR